MSEAAQSTTTPDEQALADDWEKVLEKLKEIDWKGAVPWTAIRTIEIVQRPSGQVVRFYFHENKVADRAAESILNALIAMESVGYSFHSAQIWNNDNPSKLVRESQHGPRSTKASQPWLEQIFPRLPFRYEPKVVPTTPPLSAGSDEVSVEALAYEHVNHPSHYGGDTPYEVIKVMQHWLTAEEFRGAMQMMIYRYVYRAGSKPGQPAERDLAKARFYLDALIKSYE